MKVYGPNSYNEFGFYCERYINTWLSLLIFTFIYINLLITPPPFNDYSLRGVNNDKILYLFILFYPFLLSTHLIPDPI